MELASSVVVQQSSVKATWTISRQAYDKVIIRGDAIRSRMFHLDGDLASERFWLVVTQTAVPKRFSLSLNVAPFDRSLLVLISHSTHFFDRPSHSSLMQETGFMCKC